MAKCEGDSMKEQKNYIPQHRWRLANGRYIHDGDCQFWGKDICTCGLIHHFMPNPPTCDNGDLEEWFGEEWARHDIQLNRVPEPKPYKKPTEEEMAERHKLIEELFRNSENE